MLYKEYHDARKTWETERAQRVEEKTQLVTLREQDQIRVQELKVVLMYVINAHVRLLDVYSQATCTAVYYKRS